MNNVAMHLCAIFTAMLWAGPVRAAAKLDKEACDQLRAEKIKFVQSGILADLKRGPEWGKTNLSADRLREIEHYIMLDEQLKFACREATLSADAMRAGEEAIKIEANPDRDPNAPAKPAPKAAPGGGAADGATPAGAPAVKPKAKRKSQATAKPKPPQDAYVPGPAPKSTLQTPALSDQPDVKAQ